MFEWLRTKSVLVIDALLDKYATEGALPSPEGLRVSPLNEIGTPRDIVEQFGGLGVFREAMSELVTTLYTEAKS